MFQSDIASVFGRC